MPIAPATPIQPPAQTQFVITSILVTQIEPTVAITVVYAPTDAQGNPILSQQVGVQLGAPALAQLGTSKAKLYAALATQVPAIAGNVT